MRNCLLAVLVVLLLAACGDTPPTATPPPLPTPVPATVAGAATVPAPVPATVAGAAAVPAVGAAEAAYVRQARMQVSQYQAQLANLSASADTPGPGGAPQDQTTQVVAVVQAWTKDAQQLTAPPRLTAAHQQYLAALQHLATGTALLRNAQATPGGTSTLDAAAQAELAQAGTGLQAFLSALPAAAP